MRQTPFETADVGCSQALLTFTLNKEQLTVELFVHQSFHDVGRAVGRTIVNHKDVKRFFQREYRTDNFLYVLFLVVSGNNDDAVTRSHDIVCS